VWVVLITRAGDPNHPHMLQNHPWVIFQTTCAGGSIQ